MFLSSIIERKEKDARNYMRIRKVEYLEEHKLKLLFNDNKTKIVNLEEIVRKGKGMFIP